jgi:predicted DNA-binding protein
MTAGKARRINARLPPDAARKVAYLERRRNKTTTQIVLESIDHYYEAMTAVEEGAAERLERAGFVGCARGPDDLSSTYKADLAASLREKT